MKNTAFIKLSDNNPSRIEKILSNKKKKSKSKRKYPFVVLNSDNNYGYYAKAFIKIAKENGLVCQQTSSSIRKLRTNDIIVIGDSRFFDYRIVKDIDLLGDLDGRKFRVYDLINHFHHILKRLEKYVEANKTQKQQNVSFDILGLNLLEIEEDDDDDDYGQEDINVNITIEEEEEDDNFFTEDVNTLYKKKCLPPKIRRKKPKRKSSFDDSLITIHEYWVKVGYDQYDIYKNTAGEEYIIIDDDEIAIIREDRYGRRYLDFE